MPVRQPGRGTGIRDGSGRGNAAQSKDRAQLWTNEWPQQARTMPTQVTHAQPRTQNDNDNDACDAPEE